MCKYSLELHTQFSQTEHISVIQVVAKHLAFFNTDNFRSIS